MPVKGVGNVGLKYQRVSLRDRSAFDNRKILAEVMLTTDIAKSQRQISKLVAALCDEAISVLIKKRRTVKVVVGCQTAKGSISVLRTTAGQGGVKRRFVRAEDRHARHSAVLKVATTERRRLCKAVTDNRRAALVSVHSPYLPAAEHLAGRAMVKVFLSWTGGGFVGVGVENLLPRGFITAELFRIYV